MNPFHYYFQRARHLCVYQYCNTILPNTLFFPYVTKLTLIDCSRLGISQLLYPQRFPKLEQIHYLSGHPGTYTIHERFPTSVKWIFPNRDYAFYNCMLEAGRGSKSNTIIAENIYSKTITNNITSFDIHIPGYGRKNGLFYKEHMDNYFNHPSVLSTLSEHALLPVNDEEHIHYLHYIKNNENSTYHQYERLCLEKDVMNHILKDA
jgi:hypothetical protein